MMLSLETNQRSKRCFRSYIISYAVRKISHTNFKKWSTNHCEESRINHSLDICMQHNWSHQRQQPFYQSQQQGSPLACWDGERTTLTRWQSAANLSTIFHRDSYCIRLAPGCNWGQDKEMLERGGRGRGGSLCGWHTSVTIRHVQRNRLIYSRCHRNSCWDASSTQVE